MNVPLAGAKRSWWPEDFANLFAIQGEMAHPGRFRLKGEMHVLDALLLAGGLTDRASVTQARLVRATGAAQDLLLDDILLRQDLKANILLQSVRDILLFGKRRRGMLIRAVLLGLGLGLLASLATPPTYRAATLVTQGQAPLAMGTSPEIIATQSCWGGWAKRSSDSCIR